MFAQSRSRHGHGRRRGVVLLLILAMLSIVALLGVTFATISGQAQVGAQSYAQVINNPNPIKMIDFAVEQLLNDTNNPKSAMRGHSLLRDMYGLDAWNNGYFPGLPEPFNSPMYVTDFVNTGNIYTIDTNIPTWNNQFIQYMPDLFGRNFAGYVLRLQYWTLYPSGSLQARQYQWTAQTFVIVADDDSKPYHTFTLSPADTITPNLALPKRPQDAPAPGVYAVFELDNRYRNAFNGTGMSPTSLDWVGQQVIPGPYYVEPDRPNFLFNSPYNPAANYAYLPAGAWGYFDPNNYTTPSGIPLFAPPMDEDYDAPDTENWFMAVKSADGQVIIPSFFRPWTIVIDQPNNYSDWTSPTARAKFLRPRKVDHPASGDSFPDLVPDPATGKITYDVDNDGDGVTDSIWLDLGYPVQHDASGKMFKPLFAIMCMPLNGRLPLNTAGNLDGRDLTGVRSFDHASGRGYSANEVDPRYALNEGTGAVVPNPMSLPFLYNPDGSLAGGNPPSTVNLSSGLERLRRLLTGDTTTATPGRYGEVEATNPPQFAGPGRSFYAGAYDAPWFDANYNAIDFYPSGNIPTDPTDPTSVKTPEGLPGELLSPPLPRPPLTDMLDPTGRHLLPSERLRRFVTPVDITGNGRMTRFDEVPDPIDNAGNELPFGSGFDDFGRVSFFQYFRPPGVVADALPVPDGAGDVNITETRLNLYHGYESHRNPVGANANLMARAAWDVAGNATTNDTIYRVNGDGFIQTFTPAIVTDGAPSQTGSNLSANLGFQEASQLDVYRETPYDALFTNEDLEFLLRRGDIDGSSLSDRLNRLAPDFFDNNPLASLHRNLFSTDSWETNTYAWAFQPNLYLSDPSYLAPSQVAHRGRKINLNFPLPADRRSDEPVRQKWCRETYHLLKRVLYAPDPAGTNPSPTAEQLLELGQYVVNIVDFRDPDATMTHFVHPDLAVSPAVGATPAGVMKTAEGAGSLDLWGMEYLPVAINEVMAFQYLRKDAGGNRIDQKRMLIELANMLTEDANGLEGDNGLASDLDLTGWGLMITPDDGSPVGTIAVERPNMATGQIAQTTITAAGNFIPLAENGGAPAALDPRVEALESDGLPTYGGPGWATSEGDDPRFYILSNAVPGDIAGGSNEEDEPTSPSNAEAQMDELVAQLPTLTRASGEAHYYWLHLLRPVDPLDATSTKVVVDSIRFPYFEGGYEIDDSQTPEVPVAGGGDQPQIYSVGRLQPLRGGQLVPDVENFSPPYSYGYWDQVPPDQDGDPSDYQVRLGTQRMTREIYESFGERNDPDERGNVWCHFPFHDRDFMGVAELLLVPGTPPGLFTKFFVEQRGTDPTGTPTPPTDFDYVDTIPATRPDVDVNVNYRLQVTADSALAPAYPYLPDAFFYTSNTPDPAGGPPTWNRNKSVGWHRLLEFFEVPSAAFGSIGPASEGDSGDWLRRDLRPGMINLNTIFDEEVFFGLIADPRLNTEPAFTTPALAQAPGTGAPRIVTALDTNGQPIGSYPISDLGATAFPQGRGFFDGQSRFMKAAFADFIKLRHGGSGLIGLTRSPLLAFGHLRNWYSERPFHSMSWSDLHDTVMRPARLDVYHKALPVGAGEPLRDQTRRPTVITTAPRLLFQVPDAQSPGATTFNNPATESGSPGGGPELPADHVNLWNQRAGLVSDEPTLVTAVAPNPQLQEFFLGGKQSPTYPTDDRRQHPAYRYDWLQKVLNNGTVRSHQYAVWVTVGFFEVVQEGNPQLALTNPALVVDQLGREVGKDRGESVRHRSFFIIDRTRAIGFNPMNPDDFRKMVVYERRIE